MAVCSSRLKPTTTLKLTKRGMSKRKINLRMLSTQRALLIVRFKAECSSEVLSLNLNRIKIKTAGVLFAEHQSAEKRSRRRFKAPLMVSAMPTYSKCLQGVDLPVAFSKRISTKSCAAIPA